MTELQLPRFAKKKESSRLRIFAISWCALLLSVFAFTGVHAWSHKSATCDEPLHLVGAYLQTHYGDFRCNPEDPPLWKYFVALGTNADDLKVNLDDPTSKQFPADTLYHDPRNNADALIAAGRARMIWIGVGVGVLIAWWAWRLAGPVAAMVGATAFALDPNFLAHAPLVKNDVFITLLFLGMMAFVWRLGERATWARWIGVSLLLGAALTTKFSGILAVPMLGLALALRAILPAAWPIFNWLADTRLKRMAGAIVMGVASLAVSYVFLWGCYHFRFGPSPNPQLRLRLTSAATLWAHRRVIIEHGIPENIPIGELHKWMQDWRPDWFIRSMYFVDRHHLMPEAWLSGFIYTAATSLLRSTYIFKRTDVTGVWYYFPFAMAVKTPLATIIALALAVGIVIWWKARRHTLVVQETALPDYWPLCAAAVAPALYMASAMRTHLNIGLRHVLPVYPFVFIFIGVVAANAWKIWPRTTGIMLMAFVMGLAAETYSVYPNYIPFFNVAVGGSRGGRYLLSDSNIDWGQELPDLADWAAGHPDRQIYLSYFGTPDPAYYGIQFVDIPGSFSFYKGDAKPSSLRPVYVISACSLQGTYVDPDYRGFYDRFRDKKPIAVLGGCLYIFDQP
ncbi:MAG: hypothetical protein M3O30_01305 [Planctomycetota bacterium]|nr:hypothetical protein [Planctomycetota bacterium]